ncbi:MAG: UvrD-helicase domain-containing protein [Bacteroidota bacterium]|nr:UvrD-helicase domain-containing protein [Bacteroidota bacterium]
MSEERASRLTFPSFTIVSASAGSGKTHQLAWRIVRLLLAEDVPHNTFREILAITFTRNAAGEMKQRVLGILKKIALGDADTQAELAQWVDIDAVRASARAHDLIGEILQGYSDFRLTTIDSFAVSLFQASAREFGLSPSPRIVLRSALLTDAAFDRLERNITEGSADADLFMHLFEAMERRTFDWRPFDTIRKNVSELYAYLTTLPYPLDTTDRVPERKKAERRVREAVERLAESAEKSGLELNLNFQKLREDVRKNGPSVFLNRVIPEANAVVKKGKTPNDRYSLVIDALAEPTSELRRAVIHYFAVLARTNKYPYVAAWKRLNDEIVNMRRLEGILSLNDVYSILQGFLHKGTIPEIYLRLGEVVSHYFIDEFQDTSPVQWAALQPLLEEALSRDGSVFVVGDKKQSIYAFRDADWRIMKSLETSNVFPSAKFTLHVLPKNHRSGERILECVRETFSMRTADEEWIAAAKASGLTECGQSPTDENRGKGHVEIHFVPPSDEIAEYDTIIGIIRDCRKRGYRWKDLAVLMRTNADVVSFSGRLSVTGIPFLSHSSLDARYRTVTAEMISLLRFLHSPADDLAFAAFLLGNVFGSTMRDEYGLETHTLAAEILSVRNSGSYRPLYTWFREAYPGIWDASFQRLFAQAGYAPVYDLLCDAFAVFRVYERFPYEEAALTRLLETPIILERDGRNDLADFLDSVEDAGDEETWAVQPSTGVDAVTLMTIHKAKGLDFPVTILLQYPFGSFTPKRLFEQTDSGILLLDTNKTFLKHLSDLKTRYEEEERKLRTDELNLLYVALTRAKHEMHVVAVPRTEEGPENAPPLCFLPAHLFPATQNRPPAPAWEEKKCRGDETPPIGRGIHCARTCVPVAIEEDSKKLGYLEKKRGVLMHALFERIESIASDETPQEAVQRAVTHCPVSKSELERFPDLADTVRMFLEKPEARELFAKSAGTKVYCELELAGKDGALHRLDRLVVDADRLLVVDFKSGGEEDHEEYEEQVRMYMDLADEVFPGRCVEGRIAYVDRGLVRIVRRVP